MARLILLLVLGGCTTTADVTLIDDADWIVERDPGQACVDLSGTSTWPITVALCAPDGVDAFQAACAIALEGDAVVISGQASWREVEAAAPDCTPLMVACGTLTPREGELSLAYGGETLSTYVDGSEGGEVCVGG